MKEGFDVVFTDACRKNPSDGPNFDFTRKYIRHEKNTFGDQTLFKE